MKIKYFLIIIISCITIKGFGNDLNTLYLTLKCHALKGSDYNKNVDIIYNRISTAPVAGVFQIGKDYKSLETCQNYNIELNKDGLCEIPYKTVIADFDLNKTQSSNKIVFYKSNKVNEGSSTYISEKLLEVKKTTINQLKPSEHFTISLVETKIKENTRYYYEEDYTCVVNDIISIGPLADKK